MKDLDTHRRNIATAIHDLERALDQFIEALTHRPSWLQVDEAPDDRDALRRACEAFRKIDYDMEDAPNQTLDCLGVIGVPSDVISRATQVNEAKAALKAACQPLSRLRTRVPRKTSSEGEGGPTEMIQLVRAVLRTLQRSDLNLTAAYRKIPILGAPPRSITYVRASTRAVYRKTVADIETLLLTMEGPNVSRDRARLAALSPREIHVALVQQHYANVRANVLFDRLDRRGRGRVQVVAELPLLYATARGIAPPDVRFPVVDQSAPAIRRARLSKLEPEPFLASLPVHRYLRTP